jgi:hypothetical protein
VIITEKRVRELVETCINDSTLRNRVEHQAKIIAYQKSVIISLGVAAKRLQEFKYEMYEHRYLCHEAFVKWLYGRAREL